MPWRKRSWFWYRRLILAVVVFLVVGTPGTLQAVELSELTVRSHLYEPFEGEIVLRGLPEGTTDDGASVGLASDQAHMAFGLALDPMLAELVFALEVSSDPPRIRISSSTPVRTPFLRFLLALDLPDRQLLRDYTAILDPPNYVSIDDRSVVDVEKAPEDWLYPGDRYGPVGRGETLVSIARNLDTEVGITLHQKMIALVNDNPDAFIDGNMNLMREGASLHMPSRRLMLAVDEATATDVYEMQLMAWLDRQARSASGEQSTRNWTAVAGPQRSDSTRPVVNKDSTADYVLRIVQPVPPTMGRQEKITTSPEQTQNPPAREMVSPQVSQITALTDKLSGVEEALGSKVLENNQLSQQVALLQKQLEKTMQLIELQESQLALVQQRLQVMLEIQTQADMVAGQEPEPEVPAGETPSASTQDAVVIDESPTASPATLNSELTPMAPSEVTEPGPLVEEDALTPVSSDSGRMITPAPPWVAPDQTLDWLANRAQFLAGLAGALIEQGVTHFPVVPREFDQVLGDATAPLLGLAVALLLIWLLVRRRRSYATVTAKGETELNPPRREGLFSDQPATVRAPASVEPAPVEESIGAGFVTEVETQRGVAVQSDEVDPLAEAEIYLAYGRGAQAEQTLREAIQRSPERNELKIKLLEVYRALGDLSAFKKLADELLNTVAPDSPEQAHVLALVQTETGDSDPGPPLHDGLAMPGDAGADDHSSDSVAAASVLPAEPKTDNRDQIDPGIEFEIEPAAESSFRGGSSVPATAGDMGALSDLGAGIDFDIEMPLPEEQMPVTSEPELGLDSPAAQELDSPAQSETQNEAATELDLAVAYIEMGDEAAARELLRSVIRQGDAIQAGKAETLLGQLDID